MDTHTLIFNGDVPVLCKCFCSFSVFVHVCLYLEKQTGVWDEVIFLPNLIHLSKLGTASNHKLAVSSLKDFICICSMVLCEWHWANIVYTFFSLLSFFVPPVLPVSVPLFHFYSKRHISIHFEYTLAWYFVSRDHIWLLCDVNISMQSLLCQVSICWFTLAWSLELL